MLAVANEKEANYNEQTPERTQQVDQGESLKVDVNTLQGLLNQTDEKGQRGASQSPAPVNLDVK